LVRRASEYDYEVRHRLTNGDSYSINLLRKECSCRKWLLTGLPCCHAISCMKAQDIDVNQYVPDCFRKERYEACYSHIIYLVNGQSLWRRTEYTDLQPPPIKRQPGRSKKNRRKDVDEKRDEQQLKRAKYGMKCSRCKTEGHNKSTCKLPPPPPPASQVPTSQPTSSHAPTTQVSATQASATQPPATQVPNTQVPSTTQPPATQSVAAKVSSTSATTRKVSSSQPTTSTLKRKRSPRKKKGSSLSQPQST